MTLLADRVTVILYPFADRIAWGRVTWCPGNGPDLFREGHLPGARSIPLRELRRRYREIPRGRVILDCDCSRDDLEAAYRLLVDRGVDDVGALDEGFAGWRRRGYPIAR